MQPIQSASCAGSRRFDQIPAVRFKADAHPERFVRGKPTPPDLPAEVWINQPENEHTIIDLSGSAASDTKPGAQAGSRGTALFVLDPANNLDIMEQTLDQTDVIGMFLPKFEPELSHNH